MSQHTRLIAGAMSGTSADGVDVAITRIAGRGLEMQAELVTHHHVPYPDELRRQIFDVRRSGRTDLAGLAKMGREISLTYARAVNESLAKAGLKATDLAAVAAHGQTLFHDPPMTIQWLDPSLVAYEVGCPVVSDFRRADLAAGGQGAPLVPFADYVLYRHATMNRILLNIGGIANMTYVPEPSTPLHWLIAFDIGPGNCISDAICRKHFPEGLGYDEGGNLALKGRPNEEAAKRFFNAPYFQRRPPKSTDGPEMLRVWEDFAPEMSVAPVEDQLATAALVTALSVHTGIVDHLSCLFPDEFIVSGGGAHNKAMMQHLQRLSGPNIPVRSIAEFGIGPEVKEALAFALLGAATLDGEPSNIPTVTGAKRLVVLGSITPKP